MNIAGKEFTSLHYDGATATFSQKNYNDFLCAAVVQIEYLAHDKLMPYIFVRYMPAIMPKDRRSESPVFSKEYHSVTSKIGLRFMPIKFFALDLWYERTDFSDNDDWKIDNGVLSLMFGISLSY